MSFRPVEAVFFWRYSLDSIYRPIYGRFPNSPYTKDFLQASGEQQEVLERVMGFVGQPVPIQLRWPGGSRDGNVRRASDSRANLAWITPGGPLPWRLGDPATEEPITFAGDRNCADVACADAEIAKLRDQGVEPWVVAVKLWGEDRVLHVRAYLGNPPAGQEGRSTATLPQAVREGMRDVRNAAGGAVVFERMRAAALTERILGALGRDPNVLLVGPPGTGKTVAMEQVRALFEAPGSFVGFDPDRWDFAWGAPSLPEATARKALSLVFHPSYSYEDFVAGLIPRTTRNGLRLLARPGPLLSLAHWASDRGRAGLLILDEFNRGPASAILGDTLALLDKDKRRRPGALSGGAVIQRPYPAQPMRVPPPYANAVGREIADEVALPSSLWILAALNSTDRSVAPLDAALRRRFAILYVGPDYRALADHLGITEPDANTAFGMSGEDPTTWGANDVKELAVRFLRVLNERIELVLGQDFLLGHALLWPVGGEDAETCGRALAVAFDERIASTLRLTFVDQDEALAAILNVPMGPNNAAASVGRWLEPPTALQAVAPARLELTSLASTDWIRAMRALVGLLG